MRSAHGGTGGHRCPFCDELITAPEVITGRFGNEFSGGRCGCGAVYVYDGSGHNLGEAYVDALALACDGDMDRAWTLIPDQDYEVRELSSDNRRGRFTTARRGSKSMYLFVRLTVRSS